MAQYLKIFISFHEFIRNTEDLHYRKRTIGDSALTIIGKACQIWNSFVNTIYHAAVHGRAAQKFQVVPINI